MDQKAVVKLETEKNERTYLFEMPIGAPYGECYDACFDFLQKVTTMSQEAADNAKRDEGDEIVCEEVKEEDN